MMLLHDFDERREIGFVVCGRDVRVMQLEELPCRVRGGEGRGEEVDLGFRVVVASAGVGVAVYGCILFELNI
jgi:hypothetical protein